ncbi:MAG: UPF0261 family protein [Chloroflexota bacterium]|nr:MAG: UPF0261 family protein [Chloroflexota bacterium]
MTKTIAVIAALDTKGSEAKLVCDVIVAGGCRAHVIDVGVLGEPTISADTTRADVASADDEDIAALVAAGDKSRAMAAMTRGAAVVAARLYAEGHIDGVIGLGGSAGTAIATSAMRALPIGVPKLCVSTVASGDTRAYVGTKDVTMMYSVVDIAGINRLSVRILTNAAGAIVGMVNTEPPTIADKPLLAASMFGNTTACVDRARKALEDAGYEVLVFHATGAGGQTMESLIADGFVAGVLDLTTTEWADELAGGVFSAGPTRLEAAARAGVPAVVGPGCLDMVNFGGRATVPEKYQDRNLYEWNPNVTLMRTTPEENAELGRIIAERLNLSQGPVTVLLPLKGVSQLDSEGNPYWWPEADQALYGALKANLRADIPVVEMPNNINDPEFADRAAALLLAMLKK